jgi:catalase
MPQSSRPPSRAPLGSLALIAIVVALSAGAFAYTAGWLSPQRLTPDKMIAALTPPSGPPLGHRRNHAKGICFTGTFEASGNGVALSRADVLARGRYPALGRFNLGTPNPAEADATVRVRGMGLRISTPEGREWRAAMINAPVFAVSTPQAFHELLLAAGSKNPGAMEAFAKANPEFAAFAAWSRNAPWTASYAEDRFNSLDSFIFTDASGADHAVRWSLLPMTQTVAQIVPVQPEDIEKLGPDGLETEIAARVRDQGPLRWTMRMTVANAGDPTNDPTKAWPDDRRAIDVGTLVVQQIEAEPDGPCRDINFDPTVLPPGMRTSDDPFPAARSAVYRESYDLRTAEAKDYPRTPTGAKP